MINIPQGKQLILFDGVCNLCNKSVQYIIKRDRKHIFMFAPLQSVIGQQLIANYNIDTSKTDSILLYVPEKGIHYRSAAALKISSKLTYPTRLLTIFWIFPTFLRDLVYSFIARNRYKWFGKRESCMVPTPELKDKFIL